MSDGDDNKSFLPFPAILDALSESGALVYPLYVPSGLIPESSVPKPEITIDPLRTRYLTLTTRADEEGRKLAAASGRDVLSDSSSRGFAESLRRRCGPTAVGLHDHLRVKCRLHVTTRACTHEPRRSIGAIESRSGTK
jgi:hypothetical protein